MYTITTLKGNKKENILRKLLVNYLTNLNFCTHKISIIPREKIVIFFLNKNDVF